MRPDQDDVGGAKELALYRIGVAKENLEAKAFFQFENFCKGKIVKRGN